MSLVRIPRLWTKRHSYPSWRTLPENRNLDKDDALELFKHEQLRWNHYEDEIRVQYAKRQATLVNQINQLDAYIFDTLTLSNTGIGPRGGRSLSEEQYIQLGLDQSTVVEMVTESGIYLILEDGNVIGPYLGA